MLEQFEKLAEEYDNLVYSEDNPAPSPAEAEETKEQRIIEMNYRKFRTDIITLREIMEKFGVPAETCFSTSLMVNDKEVGFGFHTENGKADENIVRVDYLWAPSSCLTDTCNFIDVRSSTVPEDAELFVSMMMDWDFAYTNILADMEQDVKNIIRQKQEEKDQFLEECYQKFCEDIRAIRRICDRLYGMDMRIMTGVMRNGEEITICCSIGSAKSKNAQSAEVSCWSEKSASASKQERVSLTGTYKEAGGSAVFERLMEHWEEAFIHIVDNLGNVAKGMSANVKPIKETKR